MSNDAQMGWKNLSESEKQKYTSLLKRCHVCSYSRTDPNRQSLTKKTAALVQRELDGLPSSASTDYQNALKGLLKSMLEILNPTPEAINKSKNGSSA